jgi:hypothetical protein
MKRTLMSAGLALLALAPAAYAQQGGQPVVPPNEAMEVMLLRISASSRCTNGCVVRGVPYSAERVTESVRVLADGNRIVQRNKEKLYRDSDGRTRVESEWQGKSLVQIQDPVAGMSYRLYPETKTGYRMAVAVPAPAARTPDAVTGSTAAVADAARVAEQLAPALAVAGAATQSRSLGTKQIDGVTAEGALATVTVPAGAAGNVRPMVTTNETWYARDLRLELLARTNNPFLGDTVTRVQNVSRLEPPTALFAVPADYTVREIVRR